ncbi:sigma-54-dependent transcriptional regulator [Microbulbifer yueqingensis]|uniref:Regulatory protein, Fis family n=1 Tax=Microbulbifer yueqingensis TaxID=658219 RepID=A0A1G8UD01_9GAMM|nr:sigma-54 dependent transcriptional regulator [Microbulbifer yueqingensis]SDJ51474.1 regulatory protein, Fis family [Microbulbifer yueqingensis]
MEQGLTHSGPLCGSFHHATLVGMGLVGTSGAVNTLRQEIIHYASARAPILLEGETGTGKEVVARALHYLSNNNDQPFLPINCGGLVDSLFEKEFFGSEKGAFTDARSRHPGYVEQAGRGTLFLDEVNSLGQKAQSSLLRFLQDQQYRAVGGRETRTAKVRLLAASNQSLEALSEDGCFRGDLMYRLNVLKITLPTLRERSEDIPILLERHLQQLNELYGRHKELSPTAIEWSRDQLWPGNIRQLNSWLHRRYLKTTGSVIFPNATTQAPEKPINGPVAMTEFQVAKQQAVHNFERSYLSKVLKICRGNISRAARMAGKERRCFGRLLKKHGLQPAHYKC